MALSGFAESHSTMMSSAQEGDQHSKHSFTKPRAQLELQSGYIIPSPSRKQQLARNDHVQIRYLVTQTLIRYDSCLDTIPGTK